MSELGSYRKYATCTKCGSLFIGTKHTTADLMLRTCGHCGYFWYETPLDHASVPAAGDDHE